MKQLANVNADLIFCKFKLYIEPPLLFILIFKNELHFMHIKRSFCFIFFFFFKMYVLSNYFLNNLLIRMNYIIDFVKNYFFLILIYTSNISERLILKIFHFKFLIYFCSLLNSSSSDLEF